MICATCATVAQVAQMAISQQEIVEMLRKLVPRVINTYKIQILNQNSYIFGNL